MSSQTTPSEHDIRLCQDLADALFDVATSQNSAIASSDSPVYRAVERALTHALCRVYGVGSTTARRVCELVYQHGPAASLRGTPGCGVPNYVQYARAWRVNY